MATKNGYKQLTLLESLSRGSVSEVERRESGYPGEGPSWQPTLRGRRARSRETPAACSDDSESFSEPDPDSLDEWLSSQSSRASSPESPERPEGSDKSRDPSPIGVGRARSRGGASRGSSSRGSSSRGSSSRGSSSRGSSSAKKARSSSRRGSVEDSWQEDEWELSQLPFTGAPGPQGPAAELDSSDPADFLELFLTEELLQHIVDQTNLYASQYLETKTEPLPHSRSNRWKELSAPELKRFLGLSFITGFIKKPSIESYWSTDELEATPYFAKVMSRNRYQLIWRFLHYNNNRSQDASDKMFKVRPVLDYLVTKFKDLYNPGKNICIDEGMMLWRGRHSIISNPQKPVKYGIKSYILCDSATGYCHNMQPVWTSSTLEDTVFSLLGRHLGRGHTLFMDNLYNSVSLSEHLLGKKTNVCGTLRKNRGEPKIIKEVTKTQVGDRIVRHNGKVMVVAWQDKRLVKMVTTCHHNTMEKVEVWQKGEKQMVPQWKPACVVEYNKCMNGLDKLDQNVAYYPFIRRSTNWSKKFVAYLFQLAMFNAFVLYRARHPQGECKNLLEFLKSVARSWTSRRQEEAGGDEECAHNPRAPMVDPESRLDGQLNRHKMEHLMATSKKERPTRRCRVCTRRGLRRETNKWCIACRVPLHTGECFNLYHSKLNYWED